MTKVRKLGSNGGQPVSDEELRAVVKAYFDASGNKSEAARNCRLHRHTFRDRLAMAEKRFKMRLGKIVDGRLESTAAEVRPLPAQGCVARYILSSCQNNTFPHKEGLAGLLAYRDWLAKQNAGRDTCEFILGSFSYAIDAYGKKAVKRGTFQEKVSNGSLEDLWYAPELVPFIKDISIQLAPALIWCGEMNILPTATNPLSGMDDYNGRASNIVPHAKHALVSVASLADEATKLNYTTGTITLRNYIQKRVGIVAERKHNYGAVIVEVDHEGNWYVRQLQIDDKGVIYDIGPSGFGGVRIQNGTVEAISLKGRRNVKEGGIERPATFVESITWGDIHAPEMDYDVRQCCWGEGGFLDQLAPRYQVMHDIFSMRSRSHHELKNYHRMFEKHANGEGSVEDEIEITADFLNEADREYCETVAVRSNHCRHLDKWLSDAQPSHDLQNARYHTELNLRILKAFEDGEQGFNVLEWALRQKGIPEKIRFLAEDESFVLAKGGAACREGIEHGLHGDLGPNGARGTTRSLLKLGRPVNKDHDHTATIMGPVYSGGACSLNFPYMKGPNAHSVSHIITFVNAARQIVTYWNGKCRA